jgi:hypothetical protein
MRLKQIVISVVFAVGLAAMPYSLARAQTPYYAFPPFWPLIALGAIIGDAATAAAPDPALAPVNYGPPYYYLGPPPDGYVYWARAVYPPGYHPPVYAPPYRIRP